MPFRTGWHPPARRTHWQRDYAILKKSPDTLYVESSYNHRFLDEMKSAVSEFKRRWVKPLGEWWFDLSVSDQVEQMARKHYADVQVRDVPERAMPEWDNPLTLAYVGRVVGQNGERYSRCFVGEDQTMSVLLALDAMQSYFGKPPTASDPTPTTIPDNHYAVLGLPQEPPPTDDDIRRAWRRAIAQWHPDVCHEPDAHEWCVAINAARAVLLSPKRAAYDIGLQLQNQQSKSKSRATKFGPADVTYAPPLRCGLLHYAETRKGAYLTVTKIKLWADDVRNGKVRTANWDAAQRIKTTWANL